MPNSVIAETSCGPQLLPVLSRTHRLVGWDDSPRWTWTSSASSAPSPRQIYHQLTTTAFGDVGVSVEREDLCRYTAGRWLGDEERQLRRRFVEFDVDSVLVVSRRHLFKSRPRVDAWMKIEGDLNQSSASLDERRQQSHCKNYLLVRVPVLLLLRRLLP